MAKAKTQVIQRVDPDDEDFSDVDGDPRTEFGLQPETMDPTRHYHWAHKSDEDIGRYRGSQLGYIVEHYEAGGVQPLMSAGFAEGEAITKRDHVLMSCDKAKWEKRNRYEQKKTKQNNDMMFRKKQADIVIEER